MAPYFHRSPVLRRITHFTRTLGYALSALSGLVIISVGEPPFGRSYIALAVFVLIGGTASSLGTATGRWVGELLGLPLLGSSIWAFALLTAEQVFPIDLWVGVPSVSILGAFGALLLSRWIDVFALSKAALREAGR